MKPFAAIVGRHMDILQSACIMYDEVRAPRNEKTFFEARKREFRKGNAATPSPPATNNAVS